MISSSTSFSVQFEFYGAGSESQSRTVVLQQPESESVQPGDSVTLQCTVHNETCAGEHSVYWFRQGSGESPPGIIYTHGTRSDECQRSSGALSPTQSCVYSFPKRNLSLSDAGTYYCAVATCGVILFGNGTKLDIEESESQSRTVVLQQPESVQPGDSVTLQCTVHTETCAGEHSVYWFRQGSGESPPGIIYTHGNRSDECQRSSGAVSPTQSCVYNFPKRNLSLSDAGTYYCAVATCGEILFGNGTKLDIAELCLTISPRGTSASLMLGLTTVLWPPEGEILFGNGTKLHTEGASSNNQVSQEVLSREQRQDEAMNYAALTFTTKKPKVRRNKREAERETVYSDMRFKERE
ncbi:hypothetical protein SKAU_G00366680 [Synaphobranchus kaupii]|uniref:Ig-like domain-containing protein n=1 Tax=Synaphobranchus kaupii TaxID=118154 RepID=A0A9Q1EF94_SYNKA|nr:hypothetical protein SKAU_G00366680 [Synaphobranchus kaupii]